MNKRRISLANDFMDYKINDIAYGFLRCVSTTIPINEEKKEYKEYIYANDMPNCKKSIARLCNRDESTITKHIKKLENNNLMIKLNGLKEISTMTDEEKAIYLFNYDYNKPYQLVRIDTLQNLVSMRLPHIIQIYAYLLNKYKYYKNYTFTLEQLKVELGYSNTTDKEEDIRKILGALKESNIIQYIMIRDFVCINKKVVPIERMKLLYVAEEPTKRTNGIIIP